MGGEHMQHFDELLAAELDDLDRVQARRSCPELSGRSRVHVSVASRPALSFASNDYLNLAAETGVSVVRQSSGTAEPCASATPGTMYVAPPPDGPSVTPIRFVKRA